MKKVAMTVAVITMLYSASLFADDGREDRHRVSAEEMGAAGLAAATVLAGGVYLVRRRAK